MERTIRRLLLVWIGLLAGVTLAYRYGYSRLAYWLLWSVALSSPFVVAIVLWLMVLQVRESWHRVRVLWRARHWRRKREADDRWMNTPWEDVDV
jgi:hypothetical protein